MFNTQTLKPLGSGIYSTVYDLGDGRVVKRSSTIDGCYHYLKWVITTIAWRRHSCCPRVHSLTIDNENGGYWAVMEKLNPLSFEDREDWNYNKQHRYRFERLLRCPDLIPDTPIGLMLCEYQTTRGYLGCSDLHGDNVMLRDDGTLVATDPFC